MTAAKWNTTQKLTTQRKSLLPTVLGGNAAVVFACSAAAAFSRFIELPSGGNNANIPVILHFRGRDVEPGNRDMDAAKAAQDGAEIARPKSFVLFMRERRIMGGTNQVEHRDPREE
jgi:hypothetical protein